MVPHFLGSDVLAPGMWISRKSTEMGHEYRNKARREAVWQFTYRFYCIIGFGALRQLKVPLYISYYTDFDDGKQ